jgi:transcriptional regulator with XRE-family HTH domain
MISTDRLIPGVLPPKEETEGTDFLKILDTFDPQTLSEDQLDSFAERYPSITDVYPENSMDDLLSPAPIPIEERLRTAWKQTRAERHTLIECIRKYEAGRKGGYQKCRSQLPKAVGMKAVLFYTECENANMTPLEKDQEIYEWEEENDLLYEGGVNRYDQLLNEKLCTLRKTMHINQKEFARALGLSAEKYRQYERGDCLVDSLKITEEELIRRTAEYTHANPFWLEAEYGTDKDVDQDTTANNVDDAQALISDVYPMFAADAVIQWWEQYRDND